MNFVSKLKTTLIELISDLNEKYKNLAKGKLFADAFLATVFVLISLFFLSKVPILHAIEYFNPTHNRIEDIELTDLYFSKIKDSTKFDDRLVIINCSHDTSRDAIAKKIEGVCNMEPKVVGIDYLFSKNVADSENLRLITSILNHRDTIVLGVEYLNTEHEAFRRLPFYKQLYNADSMSKRKINTGFIEFNAHSLATRSKYFKVREFYPQFIDKTTKYSTNSFALAIINLVDSGVGSKLIERGHPSEIINYCNYFPPSVVIYDSVPSDKGKIKDKIVLIGDCDINPYTRTYSDMHYTPLNTYPLPDKSGVEIHAQIISMILNESYIDQLSNVYVWKFVVTYVWVLFLLWIFERYDHNWWHLIFDGSFVSFCILLFLISVGLLKCRYIKIEPVHFLLPAFYAFLLLHIYILIKKSFWFHNFMSRFKKQNKVK